MSIVDDPNGAPWRATFIYGEPHVADRHRMWEILQRLKTRSQEPWVVIGDFNEAMWQYEHFSNTKRGERQMAEFREALDLCGLTDLGFSGIPWTYDNKKSGARNVKVRLDRAVATQDWANRFFYASVTHLTSPCSDHCPLLLCVQQEQAQRWGGKQCFYEIMWERDASLGERISQAWEGEGSKGDLGTISSALRGVMKALKEWSSVQFGSVRKELERLRALLAELQANGNDDLAVKNTIRTMNELLYREEMMWLQRSRISWLREGDRNTKFFHQRAVWRARKNKIRKLKGADGNWCSDRSTMEGMVNNYFSNLYTNDPSIYPQEVVSLFDQCITPEMNETLCKEFSEEEIGDALFQIGPLKAPGPDGFPARFFQRNWGGGAQEGYR